MMTLVHTLAVAEYLNFRHAANAGSFAGRGGILR